MKALCWHGKSDVRVDNVPDPKIQDPRDAIIKITSQRHLRLRSPSVRTAICQRWRKGDILGHEPMGRWSRSARGITTLKKGDRVVVPFTIACGDCYFCKKTLFSCCDTSNPNAEIAEKAMGHSPSGLFGFSHMLGGFAGGQAEYFAFPSPTSARSRSSLICRTKRCCSFPTFSRPATWRPKTATSSPATPSRSGVAGRSPNSPSRAPGCSRRRRVIAIDRVPERLAMAEKHGKAETIDFEQTRCL